MAVFLLSVVAKVVRDPRKAYRYFCGWLASLRFATRGKRIYLGKDNLIIGPQYLHVGDYFVAMDRTRIEALDRNQESVFSPIIRIGANVNIQYDCHIAAVNRVEIGDNVLIGSKVYITDHSHGTATLDDMMLPPEMRKVISKGPVVIEENVWIGEGAAVLPNVRIGKNSIVGANAVVTKDVAPFSVVAGVPARVIKSFNGSGV